MPFFEVTVSIVMPATTRTEARSSSEAVDIARKRSLVFPTETTPISKLWDHLVVSPSGGEILDAVARETTLRPEPDDAPHVGEAGRVSAAAIEAEAESQSSERRPDEPVPDRDGFTEVVVQHWPMRGMPDRAQIIGRGPDGRRFGVWADTLDAAWSGAENQLGLTRPAAAPTPEGLRAAGPRLETIMGKVTFRNYMGNIAKISIQPEDDASPVVHLTIHKRIGVADYARVQALQLGDRLCVDGYVTDHEDGVRRCAVMAVK